MRRIVFLRGMGGDEAGPVFCQFCGASLPHGALHCPACGRPVAGPAAYAGFWLRLVAWLVDSRNRISFGWATGCWFGKILSSLILGIGFLMAGFTEKKQALHDHLASCLVVRRS